MAKIQDEINNLKNEYETSNNKLATKENGQVEDTDLGKINGGINKNFAETIDKYKEEIIKIYQTYKNKNKR